MSKEMQNLKRKLIEAMCDTHEAMKHNEGLRKNHHKNVAQALDGIRRTLSHYNCIRSLLGRLSKSQNLSQKESTLIQVFSYLIIAEGGVCNSLNWASYLLVALGHDLYSSTGRKYVKPSMEEIGKVEMTTKIHFLNNHGFDALTKEYDSTLRNDITHHNYEVDKKGVLWVRGRPVDLGSKIDTLVKMMILFGDSGQEALDRWQDEQS